MFQPTEFLDGEHIVIIDGVPQYHYTGVTYRDKLKNGLTLNHVFYIQDLVTVIDDVVAKENKSNDIKEPSKFVDYEENHIFYEQKEYQLTRKSRKGKRLSFKKRHARNIKKNKVKTNGYSDKLFAIEQELPEIIEEDPYDYDEDIDETYYDLYRDHFDLDGFYDAMINHIINN